MALSEVEQEFAGRTALITGGASGIGFAVADKLAGLGANVVLADIDSDAARAAAATLTDRGLVAVGARLDVTDPASAAAAVDAAVAEFGALHLAVNNAGIAGRPNLPTGEYGLDTWDRTIATNLNGVFYCLRAELPAIVAAGGGSVVNMASMLGSVAATGIPAYAAAKHGVVGLTKTAALDYARQSVRVNSVGPGFIDTPLLDGALREQLAERTPAGRLGLAGEVAELVAFLLSERATFITGSHHLIDGGYTAG